MGVFSKIKDAFNRDNAPGNASSVLKVDVHSHMLPGIDDGAKTMEDTLEMIERTAKTGIEKIITTPHIMYEFYRNTPEIIHSKLAEVRSALAERNIQVQLEAAAEYYLDDAFISMVKNKEPLLTFGNNLVLVETNYIQSHPELLQVFFDLRIQGYTPVFAHPERYAYLLRNKDKETLAAYQRIYDSGALFQLNLMSFAGYYGPQIKHTAELLLKEGMIHMVGSDAHKVEHVRIINHMKQTKLFERIVAPKLMNNQL
ncbi:MAG: capsular biosynthesis protein [Bacteroidota bacterium]|nr:capsular biosynthesis protein [Bacteroidota bacterium]MDX5429613.1 capsular biosynthesis protein [Bacteroidota bacterium]MDX5468397.1 capsular biosynthesis protein [Bacteroidota bacterium]